MAVFAAKGKKLNDINKFDVDSEISKIQMIYEALLKEEASKQPIVQE